MTLQQLEGEPLKPCPFCGGKAVYSQALRTDEVWGIRCKVCGCSIRIGQHGTKPWNSRVGETEHGNSI